jgi:hypothetical protein
LGIKRVVLINWFSPDQSSNGACFIQKVITSLATVLQAGGRVNGVPFTLLHMNNAKSHNSKSNLEQMTQLEFKRIIHPPYSRDIAPSDFFLFGWLKGELARRPLVEIEDVFQVIRDNLRNLTTGIVRPVLLD